MYGLLRLSRHEADFLARSILILDAVIRNDDHSDATFNKWGGLPLKNFLKRNKTDYPTLYSFIFEKGNRGTKLDIELILSELLALWSPTYKGRIDKEKVRILIEKCHPIAVKIKTHDRTPDIFEAVRKRVFTED